ncbi:LysR family transcriptional regulator [Saccharopolyspora rhizosphaerae]|uniref:LysR family transcriptional regulator n=1 Tax=Saccharopolyspora rhizosphaerae TaxID=2492662 RepID=A0A3R8P5M3_9PSEU|nr:LysR family transcriptional regulator [Saccharopolyspora rhizosphaerae]RRO16883.1 LysR family transcriptional regulator [Saccharopolyspora rhizosphaerae]
MDARQLEYFLAIVDHGGFGRAAEKLHIAQPSLSQALAGLERELGVRLFHRIGRGAVLSDAGKELIGPARQVLRDLRTAKSTMDSLKGVQRGHVELVTMPSPGIEPLGTLTRLFTRRHPGVVVGADAAFTPDEVVQKVREGACELGLVGAPGEVQAPGVEVLPLESQSFVLVGADDADLPDEDPVSTTALAGARLIASPPGSQMRRIVDEVVDAGAEVVAEVAHRTSILPLVLQGVGLAVLPAAWAPLARRSGARAVLLDSPARLHVALISRSAPLTPAARAFLAVARSYAPLDHLGQEA